MITFWKKVYVTLLIPRLSVSRCGKHLGECFLHKKTFSNIEMFAGSSKGNSNKASVRASRDFSESGYTKVLPSPKKSENDKKEYKVIQLDNGMKALLIADLASDDAPDFDNSDTDGSESEDVSSDEMTGSQTGSCDPAFDTSEEEKIVHPREEKLAALGLCVGVGSFSDPWEIQGMAHFLEHMVFMGSEKYPKENDFDAFIKKRGGSDNAETDCETTTFYFECQDKHLKEAIDKFSQFFISPLMMRDAMTREREAIESEFQMGVTCDENRREQLLASWAQPKSPIRKFPWGNLKTLRDNVSDDKLYEAVHEFWARHYSADRMTLAVQARLPIETLEPWIRESFSDVKNNQLPSDNFREFAGQVFNTPEFRKMYYVKAVKDMYEVELTWALPSMLHKYHSKPVIYIEELIGHEGSGSLLSYLRNKVWAVAISAGCAEDGFSNNSMYTLFVITIVLTEEGSTHLREVLDAVFGYIKMLQNTGPSERFYQELQTIQEIKFKFAEEEPADEYVEMLATNMQFYPPEDYITGPKLFFKYDPEAITDCLNALKPEDVNIMVSCKEAGKMFDQVEPWFQTEYSVHDIPNDWIETWSKSVPNICFKMPDPNIFLTTNFELLPFSEENDEQKILYPVKIQQNDLSEVWYRRDVKFKLPQAFFYIYLISPMALSTAKNAALFGLYTEILQQMLTEKLYPAHVADLTCQVYPGDKGLVLKFIGYNQKLHLVLETVVNCMTKFVSNLSANLFNALKAIQIRNYYNTFLKPDKLGRDVRLSIVLQKYFNSVDRHTALADVTMPVLKEFAEKFSKQLYIQSLFQGNLTQKQAKFVCNRVVEILKFGPLSPDTFPEIRVHQIPLGDYYCRVKSFNLDDTNSVVTNYYQSRTFDLKNYCIVELIMMLMEEPVFDVLRTKEQLGYHVYSTLRYTFGVIGFSVTVNCQAVKHSVEHVDSRIEAFLQKFVKMLKTTQEKELAEVRSALIKLKTLSDVHLKEEVNRNWEEIVSREYMFDRQQREIVCLEKINMPEIRKWFLQHVMCGNKNNLRKLSVQVVGSSGAQKTVSREDTYEDKPAVHISKIRRHSKERPHTSDASTDTIPTNSPSESQFTIEFITEDEERKKKKKNQTKHFISNIEEFKRNLELYPIVRNSKQ